MKILIYGSTVLSERVARALLVAGHDVVGYVKSNATFPGRMPIPEGEAPCDIKLSVQYDKKMVAEDKSYNIHTGLLPEYGGCNILSHTLLNKDTEQGLTFHKISESYDNGEILLKLAYPVLKTDTVSDLYHKMLALVGQFAVLSIEAIGWDGHAKKPTIYKRADVEIEMQKRHVQEIMDSL